MARNHPPPIAALAALAITGSLGFSAAQYSPSQPRSLGRAPSAVPALEVVSPPDPAPTGPGAKLLLLGVDGETTLEIAPFDEAGAPIPAAMAALEQFFRSKKGHVTDIEPRLIRALLELQALVDGAPLQVISAHRQPGRGTSFTSYHVRGMAVDVAVAHMRPLELYRIAERVEAFHGIGLYRGFVHVDVRDDQPPYRWSGG